MDTTLLGRMRIADLVANLAHAQDSKDWGLFRSLFADRMTLDLTERSGEPVEELTADEITAKTRTIIDGFTCTHHASSNLLVDIHGETARCRAHMVAYHHVPTPGVDHLTMRGYWHLDLASANGKWVIRRWAIVRAAPWEGNQDLYRIAREGAQTALPDSH
ncbi:nuclear transport factor 2 family protein [Actinacidiphila sp. DG2A-62]|uniref:nuclear transport factor 2 family protein n=1 Tax=Actinacidiphila sp. DG2A-62 TaxID=3108821 RepID=UPI002DBDC0C7|nr:nuclear transport factor 2 family protein [Actinacidiphila sp. DG2A-62]MEC3997095.1 nuclear transport factor 2 family protein [Actinacidiphila sp. DG2A-62]